MYYLVNIFTMIEQADDQSSNRPKFSIINKKYILSHSSNSIYNEFNISFNPRESKILF